MKVEGLVIQLRHLVFICTIWYVLKVFVFYINWQYPDLNVLNYTSYVLVQSLSFCFKGLYDAFEKLFWPKFIAFAYNGKRSAIVIVCYYYYFYYYFIRSAVFGRTAKSFSANILRLVTTEALVTTKIWLIHWTRQKIFLQKLFPKLLFATRVAHGTANSP